MMQRNAHDCVACCFEDRRREHEQEDFHASCSQVLKRGANLSVVGDKSHSLRPEHEASANRIHCVAAGRRACKLLIYALQPRNKEARSQIAGKWEEFESDKRLRSSYDVSRMSASSSGDGGHEDRFCTSYHRADWQVRIRY